MSRVSFTACFVLFLAFLPMASVADDRPNILWITAEDMSPVLGCYGDTFATTPSIDHLAAQSVRYTHAFATAPVCSPVRSCLITGVYATTLGTHNMRSAFAIPNHVRGFPAYLRDAGYYTTNNVKTDYNTSSSGRLIKESWNESNDTAHWRKRAGDDEGKPFFSVFNLMTSHQSRTMQWPQSRFRDEVQSRLATAVIHDPAKAPLPPYYPDTMVVRRTVARYYDSVSVMDSQVGAILEELERDGLADDTIVFFFSDHGSGMPRHKRVLLDSGMHVPLLVRFPDKYAHLAPAKPGESVDQLISFVDFAPTALSLAGLDKPDAMQGQAFLGQNTNSLSPPRKYVYGHRDRIDEAIDLSRSVRDARYLYVRNYMPHLGWNERSRWPDLGEINHDFYRLSEDDTSLPVAVRQFIASNRPLEELYDCDADPHNINNLASSAAHAEILERMRAANQRHLAETRDVGFIPESVLWDRIGDSTPWDYGLSNNDNVVQSTINVASMVARASESRKVALLDSDDSAHRYWASVALIGFESPDSAKRLRQLAQLDPVPAVRTAAANALGRSGRLNEVADVLTGLLEHEELSVVLHAARTIELFGEQARFAVGPMRKLRQRVAAFEQSTSRVTFDLSKEADLAMFCGFSIDSFLAKLQEEAWIDLFDGESLKGWRSLADGQLAAKDGEITMHSDGKNLWLLHNRSFTDFELVAEAKMPADPYNSGIAFRCNETPSGRPSGYQCEIAARKSGMLYGIGKGWIWPDGDQQQEQFHNMAGNAFRPDAWNHFRIRCEADKIQIWVNGILTADVADSTFRSGAIAIQHHGRGALHRFRNLRIRPIKSLDTNEANE